MVSGQATPPAQYHVVTPTDFDSLAAGGGDPETINLLKAGERSRRLLLLRAVLDGVAAAEDFPDPLPSVREAWNVLITIQNGAPELFDTVLMQPETGMWLGHSLRRLNEKLPQRIPLWVDTGYMFNIAIAAAARAGIELDTMVPCRDGTVMLPTLGLARLPGGSPFGVAKAFVADGGIRLTSPTGRSADVAVPGESDTPVWQRLRRIRSRAGGHELSVWLDDIDPYRQIGEPVPPERLSETRAQHWQRLFDQAYAIVAQDNPPLAAAMSLGFISIIPLRASSSPTVQNASSGDSFGSALISMPPDPTALAVTLVHEFQHIKLGGLMHLLPLYRDGSEPRYYAPWRDDPRPLSGLLQGVYAFQGVTDFWRLRRRSAESAQLRDLAEFEFALWRERTWHASQVLRADTSLTNVGRRFTEVMANTMRTWRSEQVRPQIASAARIATDDHRIGWRIRHLRPGPSRATELAVELHHGQDARSRTQPTQGSQVIPNPSAPWSHQRATLLRLRFSTPEKFAHLLRTKGGEAGLLAADLALVSGDDRNAIEAYVTVLRAEPTQLDAWAGLMLALFATNQEQLQQPELLPALYRELLADPEPPDPKAIARWLLNAGY